MAVRMREFFCDRRGPYTVNSQREIAAERLALVLVN
jgi:hypothetical protein